MDKQCEIENVDVQEIYDQKVVEKLSFGDKMADYVSTVYGSWTFIIGQSLFMLCWMIWNSIPGLPHWDDAPFVLLNLILSFEAAYCGSFLQMSSNRQSKKDRAIFEHDYEADLRSEKVVCELRYEVAELKLMIEDIAKNQVKK